MTEEWIPDDIPLDKPSPARIYDYFLGGYHNFAQDRAVAEQLLQILPELFLTGQVNRSFLRRAVTLLLEKGIDQFLDIGSGIPTMGNVHEVAQAVNPEARVVYVDIDPVAVAHCRSMLANNSRAVAIRGDVRDPGALLEHTEVQRMLDFERPVGLLMVALLHYVVDDELAYSSVDRLREALAPGSYMVVAHSTIVESDKLDGRWQAGSDIFRKASETVERTLDQVQRFFGDWQLVEPGVVQTPLWRPEGPNDVLLDDPVRGHTLAGVAWKSG